MLCVCNLLESNIKHPCTTKEIKLNWMNNSFAVFPLVVQILYHLSVATDNNK